MSYGRLQLIIPIVAVLSGALFTSYYADFYNKPDVKINTTQDFPKYTISLSNTGRIAATDLVLTIKGPTISSIDRLQPPK